MTILDLQTPPLDYTLDIISGLATIQNVELVSTGSWDASTGPVTFTEGDLQAALAAVDDPMVKEPRLIIGHTDPSVGITMSGKDGFFGEQPTIGRFTNLRMADNGQTIVSDLVGVPEWLAKILPAAYPSRSIEGYRDVTSASGKTHSFVIPRVAVLGVNLPAVASLEDLQTVFSTSGPEGVKFEHVGERVAASRGTPMTQRVTASTSYEDVRRAFYDDFAVDDRYWWWIRAVFVNPSKLIVDDDEGGLWAVPYSATNDAISFADPVEIFTQYVEKDSGKVAASATITLALAGIEQMLGTRAAASWTNAVESRPTNRPKEVKMGITVPVLRERLGLTAEQLPDDATEDQINEVLAAPPAAPPAEEEVVEEPTAIAASGGVVLDAEAWKQQQERTARLEADLATRIRKENEGIVIAASKAGKFPPSRKDHYVKLMEKDPEGTTEFLNSLEAGSAVPLGELGGDDGGNDSTRASSEYEESWLSPSERARARAAREGSEVPIPAIVTEA